jgi:hypothetical protein
MFARFDQRMQEQRANPTHTYHALHETHRQVAEQLRKDGQAEAPKPTDAEILADIRRQMERARERERDR